MGPVPPTPPESRVPDPHETAQPGPNSDFCIPGPGDARIPNPNESRIPVPDDYWVPLRRPILDRIVRPSGLIPRHAQLWVVLGLAALMMAIIAISGPSRPREKPPVMPVAAAMQPDQARIQEYRNRIDAESRRLAAAQAELEGVRRSLATQPTPVPGPVSGALNDSHRDRESAVEDAAAREDVQRERRAPFADNVALTFRPREDLPSRPPTVPAIGTSPMTDRSARLPVPGPDARIATSTSSTATPESQSPVPSTSGTGLPALTSSVPGSTAARAPSAAAAPCPPITTPPSGAGVPRYRLLEGTIIEAVLTNRLDGSFAGPVNLGASAGLTTTDERQRNGQCRAA